MAAAAPANQHSSRRSSITPPWSQRFTVALRRCERWAGAGPAAVPRDATDKPAMSGTAAPGAAVHQAVGRRPAMSRARVESSRPALPARRRDLRRGPRASPHAETLSAAPDPRRPAPLPGAAIHWPATHANATATSSAAPPAGPIHAPGSQVPAAWNDRSSLRRAAPALTRAVPPAWHAPSPNRLQPRDSHIGRNRPALPE